jgi:hypothetical protein
MKKYIVATGGWGHIFEYESAPSCTKWVLDVAARKLVCGFVLEGRYWEPLVGDLLLDLHEDVECNIGWIDGYRLGYFDLLVTNRLPAWAKKPATRHL